MAYLVQAMILELATLLLLYAPAEGPPEVTPELDYCPIGTSPVVGTDQVCVFLAARVEGDSRALLLVPYFRDERKQAWERATSFDFEGFLGGGEGALVAAELVSDAQTGQMNLVQAKEDQGQLKSLADSFQQPGSGQKSASGFRYDWHSAPSLPVAECAPGLAGAHAESAVCVEIRGWVSDSAAVLTVGSLGAVPSNAAVAGEPASRTLSTRIVFEADTERRGFPLVRRMREADAEAANVSISPDITARDDGRRCVPPSVAIRATSDLAREAAWGAACMFPEVRWRSPGGCATSRGELQALDETFCPSFLAERERSESERRAAAGLRSKKAVALGRACDSGKQPSACLELGRMHNQAATPSDWLFARDRFRSACELGELSGCDILSEFHRLGQGSLAEFLPAVAAFRGECQRKKADACWRLGHMYGNGFGVRRDLERARTLYAEACRGGAGGGCAGLASMEGMEFDAALELFERACKLRHGPACTRVGYEHHEGELSHSEAQKRGANLRPASRYYDQACRLNDAAGCAALARICRFASREPACQKSPWKKLELKACALGDRGACRAAGKLPADDLD